MKALWIALKDIRLALRDSGTLVYLFLLPLLFIFVFGGGLGAVGDDAQAEAARLPLPVVNLDPGGAWADELLARLEATGTVEVIPMERADAESQLETRRIEHVLYIPEAFSETFDAGTPVTLRLENHPSVPQEQTEIFQLAVDNVAQKLALEHQIVASLEHIGQMQTQPEERAAFSTDRIVAQAQNQFERSQQEPLVGATRMTPGQIMAPVTETSFTDIQIKVPGFAVLFIFLVAQSTARSIYDEKKNGSFRRLLAAPMNKFSLLMGKLIPNFVIAIIQCLMIFAAGMFILPLVGLEPLSLGSEPLAVIALCLLVAFCSTSLGILIASFARTENQIGGLSTVLIWGMGIVGGAFMPAFLMGDFMNTIGKFVPQYWAIDGFYRLLVLGEGLSSILPSVAIILVFSVAFFAVGMWRFEYR